VRDLASQHELLIVTGGLGPTDDDLTREALNDVVARGQQLVEDALARRWLEPLVQQAEQADAGGESAPGDAAGADAVSAEPAWDRARAGG
jgi:molybdopterin-biosynthesis enzyme MoeA-like protein